MLHDIEFPLVIKICVIPGFNQTALQEAGYSDMESYFLGQNWFDIPTVGWAGITNENETLGTVEEVLAKVKNYGVEDVLEDFFVWTTERERIPIPLKYLNDSRVTYPHNCLSLALSDVTELDGENIRELFIDANLGDYSLEVQLKGASLNCRRNIKDHNSFLAGHTIKLEENGTTMSYNVDISQRIFVEEDPTNGCRDYPNADFSSYQECDDNFLGKQLPNITPIWLTGDLAEVTTLVSDDGAWGE